MTFTVNFRALKRPICQVYGHKWVSLWTAAYIYAEIGKSCIRCGKHIKGEFLDR